SPCVSNLFDGHGTFSGDAQNRGRYTLAIEPRGELEVGVKQARSDRGQVDSVIDGSLEGEDATALAQGEHANRDAIFEYDFLVGTRPRVSNNFLVTLAVCWNIGEPNRGEVDDGFDTDAENDHFAGDVDASGGEDAGHLAALASDLDDFLLDTNVDAITFFLLEYEVRGRRVERF